MVNRKNTRNILNIKDHLVIKIINNKKHHIWLQTYFLSSHNSRSLLNISRSTFTSVHKGLPTEIGNNVVLCPSLAYKVFFTKPLF